MQGRIVSDPKYIRNGNIVINLEVNSVADKNHNHISASGVATVFLPAKDKCRLYRNDTIRITELRILSREPLLFSSRASASRSAGGPLMEGLRKGRIQALNWVNHIQVDSGEWAPLFTAMFTGDQRDLQSDVKQIFWDSGCSHLLALSGFHLGIFITFLGVFLSRIFPAKPWFLLCLPVLTCYWLMTGCPPSLSRAFIFFVTLRLSNLFFRKSTVEPLIILGLTLTIQFLLFPEDLLTLSCKISYLAMIGLLGFSGLYSRFFEQLLPSSISGVLAVTFSAQLFVIPFIRSVMGTTNPYGLIISPLLQLPVWTFFQGGLIHLLVSIIPGPFPDNMTDLGQSVIFQLIRFLAVEPIQFVKKIPGEWNSGSITGCFFLTGIILIPLSGWIIHILSNRLITILPPPYGRSLNQEDSHCSHDSVKTF